MRTTRPLPLATSMLKVTQSSSQGEKRVRNQASVLDSWLVTEQSVYRARKHMLAFLATPLQQWQHLLL
jgi:hypothetical protein